MRRNRPAWLLRLASLFLVFGGFLGEGIAQPDRRPTRGAAPTALDWDLPTDPRLWHNSPPLSFDGLSGKGIVFYFFEEECQRCASRWAPLQQAATRYGDEPVLFIAVNSGTEAAAIRRYVGQQRVRWPLVHDADRSLERAMGVTPLDLRGQRTAVKYITAQGELRDGDRDDFDATVEAALKGASWRTDPEGLPQRMRRVWWSIETGDFAGAASGVMRAIASDDDEAKQWGERLQGAVRSALEADADAVRDLLASGDDWAAYKRLDELVRRYDGYGLTERAAERRDVLAKSVDVRSQLTARELLDKALSTASRGTAGATRRAGNLLNRVVEEHAGTEAAERAGRLLSQRR